MGQIWPQLEKVFQVVHDYSEITGMIPSGICQAPTPRAAGLRFQPVSVLFIWLVEPTLISSTGYAYESRFDRWISKATFLRRTFMVSC